MSSGHFKAVRTGDVSFVHVCIVFADSQEISLSVTLKNEKEFLGFASLKGFVHSFSAVMMFYNCIEMIHFIRYAIL